MCTILSPLSSLSADVPKVEVLEQELAWLEEHLSQLESPVVFCHNDLLCKNIIYDRDKGTAPHAPQMQRTQADGWSAGFQERWVLTSVLHGGHGYASC